MEVTIIHPAGNIQNYLIMVIVTRMATVMATVIMKMKLFQKLRKVGREDFWKN